MPQVLPQEHPGTIKTFGGANLPPSYLECDGSSLSTTAYPKLFAAIGYTHGGSGATFNIPDLRGVFIRGAGTNGAEDFGGQVAYTPQGGALGFRGRQTTAVNNLGNYPSSVSVSVSVSGNKNQFNSNQNPHTHTIDLRASGANTGFPATTNLAEAADIQTGSATVTWASSLFTASGSGSGTADAQGMYGDAETVPAYVALRYIIRV
jgi:microcystin-dependent protein